MHSWCVLDTHPICIRNAHLNFSNDAHLDAFHMRIKNASMIPTLTLIQLIQDRRFQCISDAHQKCWNALMQCLKRFKCVSCSLGIWWCLLLMLDFYVKTILNTALYTSLYHYRCINIHIPLSICCLYLQTEIGSPSILFAVHIHTQES